MKKFAAVIVSVVSLLVMATAPAGAVSAPQNTPIHIQVGGCSGDVSFGTYFVPYAKLVNLSGCSKNGTHYAPVLNGRGTSIEVVVFTPPSNTLGGVICDAWGIGTPQCGGTKTSQGDPLTLQAAASAQNGLFGFNVWLCDLAGNCGYMQRTI